MRLFKDRLRVSAYLRTSETSALKEAVGRACSAASELVPI
jgi:hypothetical protein